MKMTPQDVQAVADVLKDVSEESDHMPIEHAALMREEVIRLIVVARETLSLIETEMLRQCEGSPKVVDMPDGSRHVFLNSPDYSLTFDHHLVLDRMWKTALDDGSREDGSVDWGVVGQIVETLVTSLYLSPSREPKREGLKKVGIDPRAVESKTLRARKLIVHTEA